ncbi:hypothetical protein FRX31_030908, partial [Thalictrum thalictroides]
MQVGVEKQLVSNTNLNQDSGYLDQESISMAGLDDKHSHSKQSKTDGKEMCGKGMLKVACYNASDSILQSISVATREKHTAVKMTSYAPMGTNENGGTVIQFGSVPIQPK